MTRTRWAIIAIAAALGASAVIASSVMSCAATPTVPPLRSFESAKDIDVVCLQVYTTSASGQVPGVPVIPPIPVEQQLCAPVPLNYTGLTLPYHLFALVTQTARGEVAVVDLTAGQIIDEDPATPGNQFLPVGANPAGIAAAPNGAMTFVTSADPTKPAIYGLPSVSILGAGVTTNDAGVTMVFGGTDAQAPTILSWPACLLPAVPGPIVAIPRSPLLEGEHDDGGPDSQGYLLSVVLPGDGQTQVARVVTIDPRPLLRGGGIDIGPGPSVSPASLAHCPILSETPLSGNYQAQTSLGPPWYDGVRYVVEGGPPVGSPQAAAVGYVGPSPLPLPGFICAEGGVTAPEGGTAPPGLVPGLPQATSAARAGNYLYVGDQSLPLIHVLDYSNPLAPKEIEPLVATSAVNPQRRVVVSKLAVSPVTREFRRYLYALDQQDTPASIIVYDVTDPKDPAVSPHVPLTRPHAELTPQLPIDRIQFTASVATLAFAVHDFPLTTNPATGANYVGAAPAGLLCDPNPAVDTDASYVESDGAVVPLFSDAGLGAFYRNNFQVQQVSLGPSRLRGVFGFATLTNGNVTLIDVDDWDSPCRRPISMTQFTNDIAPPEQNSPPGENPLSELFPYQVPEAGTTNGIYWVTDELFFPVSQPHRPRSNYPLDNDPLLGIHYPEVQPLPTLVNLVTGAGLTVGTDAGVGNPIILPPDSGRIANPTGYDGGAAVELAWEDPTVHLPQSWTVTYEGQLPTFNAGTIANIDTNPKDSPPNSYETLVLDFAGGGLCEKGVEDWAVGQERASAAIRSKPADVELSSNMKQWVGDYVQVANDLLGSADPYWTTPQACWSDTPTDVPRLTPEQAENHFLACYNYFQPAIQQAITRDFPIIEAYDDHLVVTRFNYPPLNVPPDAGADAATYAVPETTSNRWITAQDPSNAAFLRTLQCCFNKQATFNVRTGGEWVASGSTSGLLHHVIAEPVTHRCVLSCDPATSLLNARNFGFFTANPTAFNGGMGIDRNSPLSMRNPMLSYYVVHPLGPWPTLSPNDPSYMATCQTYQPNVCDVQRVQRDLSWEFSTIYGFTDQVINLASTGTQVSPQSMLFIPSFGQLAVVDGAQEGLVLIDLNSVAVSGSPYF
jgi:hypothetical protein